MGVLLLDSINQPADLKQLNEKQVEQLCEEIRSFLLKNISKTGGHLASNLGMVELTAVSYTHLRAHETDSYLVCRLLLEKKKKSKPLHLVTLHLKM